MRATWNCSAVERRRKMSNFRNLDFGLQWPTSTDEGVSQTSGIVERHLSLVDIRPAVDKGAMRSIASALLRPGNRS
jgi:hypothetical protein